MNFKIPIYGKDFGPWFVGFSRRTVGAGSVVNNTIIFFDTLRESCDFAASHAFTVINETTGIESSVHGVEYFDLQKRLARHDLEFVFREPVVLDDKTKDQMHFEAMLLEKKEVPYDYTGLVFGHPIAALNLARWIKPLRRFPVFFHWPGSLVCSNLSARILKAADAYKGHNLMKTWHITRITPAVLYNYGPFKPYKIQEDRTQLRKQKITL